jgi:hypothetical protein
VEPSDAAPKGNNGKPISDGSRPRVSSQFGAGFTFNPGGYNPEENGYVQNRPIERQSYLRKDIATPIREQEKIMK